MVILSLADFHTQAKSEEKEGKEKYVCQHLELQRAVDGFCKYIQEEIIAKSTEEAFWKPDYLCVCGDIAHGAGKDEYEVAGGFIAKIAEACGLPDQRILMVPGNHDMNIKDLAQGYIGAVENILYPAKGVHEVDWVKFVFKNYSDFRSSFIPNPPSSGYKRIPGSFLPYINDMVAFEEEKVLFVELNSTWRDVAKVEKKPVRFGSAFIKKLYDQIQDYKLKGYYVVTLFHHSLRFMDLLEYQPSGSMLPVYDMILEMSDLCLSGHEHGREAKSPDMLGNVCQYVLNGGFFAADSKNGKSESSATLIKIDRCNERIHIRRFVKEYDNNWKEKSEIKSYRNDIWKSDSCQVSSLLPGKLLNELTYTCLVERLIEEIVQRIWGDGYQPRKEQENDSEYVIIDKQGVSSQRLFIIRLKECQGEESWQMKKSWLETLSKRLEEDNNYLPAVIVGLAETGYRADEDKKAYEKLKEVFKKAFLRKKVLIIKFDVVI